MSGMVHHLGVTLRLARTRGRVPASAIATAAGVDQATVYRLERGEAWPRDPGRLVDAYAATTGLRSVDLWAMAVRRWLSMPER